MPNPREAAVNPMNRIRWGASLAGLLVVLLSCDGGGGTGPVDDDPTDGSAFVGPGGGFVSIGSQVRVDVPQGALGEGVILTIRPVPTPPDLVAEGAIGQAYRVEPVDLQLVAPFRLEITVPESVRGGIPTNVLTLRRSTTANAALAPAGVILSDIQTTGNGVSGSTGTLGTFSAAAPQNSDPTASAGGDQDVVVGDRVNLSGSGNDPDGDPLTFSWSVTAPDGSTVNVESPDQASASFVADQPGDYTATLTVTDDEGATASSTATITARENRPPSADAGTDQTVAPGTTVQLDGSGSSDPDGQPLTFSWAVTAPDGSSVTVTNPDQPTASFDADQLGDHEVTLTVEDTHGATSSATITITVAQGNQAPTVNAGGDQSVAVGDRVDLNGFAQDPDGDPLTFTWTVLDPDGNPVTVENPNQSLASFVAAQAGTYTVTLTVDDGRGGTASSTILVNASASGNRAPTADAGPNADVPLNQAATLDGSGSSDPDGDNLSYMWVQVGGPDVEIADPMARRASFTPTEEGDYEFELTVEDGEFAATDAVTITAMNMAPNVTVTGPALVVTDVEVTFTATATDPDGDALTFDWTVTDPSGVEVATGTGTSIAFTPADFGSHTVTVEVSDGTNEVTATHTVDVNLSVAGTYPGTTFSTTSVSGCSGIVPTGSTTGDLVVEQPDPSTVILRLSDLTDFIANDPVGTLEENRFDFSGTITVTDGSTTVDATGTITGTFTAGPPPGMDLTFTFTPNALPGCVVSGTIIK